MHRVDQLTGRRHQLAPEILMMTADHQVDVILLNGIDVNLGDMQKRISEETHTALKGLSEAAGYPISETLSGSGDLGQVLVDAIKKYDVDLVVCGHHHDFWSKLMSSARQLINTVHIDMLIVPLRDEEE